MVRNSVIVFVVRGRLRQNVVDKTVLFRFLSIEEEVSIGVLGNLINRFPGVSADDAIQDVTVSEHFSCLNFDVANLTTYTTHRLMHHDTAVGQAGPLTFSATHQEYCSAAASLPNTVGRNGAGKNLHGVVYRQSRSDAATRGVDVKMNIFSPVLTLKIEEFHDDVVCVSIVDFTLQKNNPVLKQQVTESKLSLALIGLIRVAIENLVGLMVVRDWKIHSGSFNRFMVLGDQSSG